MFAKYDAHWESSYSSPNIPLRSMNRPPGQVTFTRWPLRLLWGTGPARLTAVASFRSASAPFLSGGRRPSVIQAASHGDCAPSAPPRPPASLAAQRTQQRALWLFPIGAWLLRYHHPWNSQALLPQVKGELLPGLPLLAMADWAVTELNKNNSLPGNFQGNLI